MTNLTQQSIDRAEEISVEQTYEEIGKLSDVEIKETGGVTVYSGVHPDHGAIHIVVPPLSTGILLKPFAIRQF